MSLRVTERRAVSLMRSVTLRLISILKIFAFRAAFPDINLSYSTRIDKGARLSATDGGIIGIGSNVFLGPNAQIIARGGRMDIGDNVHVGSGSIIVSQSSIAIGRDTLIAEFVVIRDQDHSYSARPIRTSGFVTGAIAIGVDCWLGCKSTVLRNSSIGNGSVVGAHSLIRGDVPPFTLAVGCPHKIVRELPPS